MMATGAEADEVEVGYFGAGQFIPAEELSAGMVGYITASIKNVRDTRVGDTITDRERPCEEALPGYKKVLPMVYCGMYPADGAKYPDLRDALEKLQLNDASLQLEPETSIAMGFGFRAGNGVIHAFCLPLHLFRKLQAVDDLGDMARRGVMMAVPMVVTMVVLVAMVMAMLVSMVMRMFMAMAAVFFCRFCFFFPVHRHRHMGTGNAAGSAGLGLQTDAGQPQPVHHIKKALFIVQKFVQGRHQHIACRPHIAFNVQRFHRLHPPFP